MSNDNNRVVPFPLSDDALDRLADLDLAAVAAQIDTMADEAIAHLWNHVHAPDGHFGELRAGEAYDPTYFNQLSVLLSTELARRGRVSLAPRFDKD